MDVDGTRCERYSIGNSTFCEAHSKMFKAQYLKYKDIENILRKKLIKTRINADTDIYELLKFYSMICDAWQRRVNFRKKAFVPDAWDYGHDLRIRFLQTKALYVIEILKKKFDVEQNIISIVCSDPEEDKKDIVDLTDKQKVARINVMQKKIVDIEKEFDYLVPKYEKKSKIEKFEMEKFVEELDVDLQKEFGLEYVKGFNIFFGFICDMSRANNYDRKLISSVISIDMLSVFKFIKTKEHMRRFVATKEFLDMTDKMKNFGLNKTNILWTMVNQNNLQQIVSIHNIYKNLKNRQLIKFRFMRINDSTPYGHTLHMCFEDNVLQLSNKDFGMADYITSRKYLKTRLIPSTHTCRGKWCKCTNKICFCYRNILKYIPEDTGIDICFTPNSTYVSKYTVTKDIIVNSLCTKEDKKKLKYICDYNPNTVWFDVYRYFLTEK